MSSLDEKLKLEKMTKTRAKIVEELLTTEKLYINDLHLTAKEFYVPLKERRIIKDKEIRVIFSNMNVLLGVNVALLKELEKEAENPIPPIGSTFCWMSDFLKMYSDYCNNQAEAFKILARCRKENPRFQQFLLEIAQKPELKGLQLNAFLIKPVQRITKYPLFLNELLKNTPDSHPEHTKLKEAIVKVQFILNLINEHTKYQENQLKINELRTILIHGGKYIKPDQVLIQEDDVMEALITRTENNKSVIIHKAKYLLFDKVLMRTRPIKKTYIIRQNGPKFKVTAVIPLSCLRGLNNVMDTGTEIRNAFELVYQINRGEAPCRFLVMASSPLMKRDWILHITQQLTK